MLQSIVNRVLRSADSLISHYLMILALAVPFAIALGFGTAAGVVKLTEIYGSAGAYGLMSAAFTALGLIAIMIVSLRAPRTAQAEKTAEAAPEAAAETGARSKPLLDPEMALSALATMGPSLLPWLLRQGARNVPLLAFLALIGFVLFSRSASNDNETAADAPAPEQASA